MKKNISRSHRILMSLGYNCEPDFKIHKFDKTAESYAFTWAKIVDREKWLLSLNDLPGLLEGDPKAVDSEIVSFSKYEVGYHVRPELIKDGNPMGQDSLAELRSRVTHLIEKTERIRNDPKAAISFVQSIPATSLSEDSSFVTRTIEAVHKAFPSPDIQLFVVFDRKKANKNLYSTIAHPAWVHICFVNGFDSPRKRGDLWGWLKILKQAGTGSTLRYLYSDSPFLRVIFRPMVMLAGLFHHKSKLAE